MRPKDDQVTYLIKQSISAITYLLPFYEEYIRKDSFNEIDTHWLNGIKMHLLDLERWVSLQESTSARINKDDEA